jgi:hypothetical protein
MASIKMIPEEEATGKVKEIYEEIQSQLGIDFVPNLYKVMASKPDYLEVNWNKVKAVMVEEGKLAVQELGLDDEGVLELMAVVDLFSGFNKLMDGLRVEPDEKPWYG